MSQSFAPPVAPQKPRAMTRFGDRRVDPWAWLRDKSDPAVTEYLNAENRYTEAVMKPLAGFRDTLYKEILGRIRETDESVPYRRDGYWYYQREVEGLQYPIFCRRRGTIEAREEVILDVNELARGHKYTSVGLLEVSPDAKLLAYTVDFTGYRQYTMHVKDLASGGLLADSAARVTSAAWAADNRTLFYVEEHETTKRSYRLHRKALGGGDAALLYEEADERFDIGVGETRSGRYVVLGAHSKDAAEMRFLASDDPGGEFRLVEARRAGHEYFLDHRGDEFFIRTNDKGANFRLVRAPAADPARRNWKEVVRHRPMVMLEEIHLFRDFWVLVERDKGLVNLRFTDFASGKAHQLAFDEAVYSAHAGINCEFDTRKFRFVYESLVTPRSWYDYDVATRKRKLLKRQPVLGPYDPSEYASPRWRATARACRSRSSTASRCAARARSRSFSMATARTGSRWIRGFPPRASRSSTAA